VKFKALRIDAMGLISKVFRGKEAVSIKGDGGFDLEIVNESNYIKNLKSLCGGYSKEGSHLKVKAELHYENNNTYDKQAIRVDINKKTVGYLAPEDARLYRKRIKKIGHGEITVLCDAAIVGGKKVGLFEKSAFSVWLDLPVSELTAENFG
jgi:hypothetical protein